MWKLHQSSFLRSVLLYEISYYRSDTGGVFCLEVISQNARPFSTFYHKVFDILNKLKTNYTLPEGRK
jgi:hypothetical protein